MIPGAPVFFSLFLLAAGLLCLVPGGGRALAQKAQDPDGERGSAKPQVRPDGTEQGPSLELLDFLGGFTTDDGQTVDPEDLEELPPGKETSDAKRRP